MRCKLYIHTYIYLQNRLAALNIVFFLVICGSAAECEPTNYVKFLINIYRIIFFRFSEKLHEVIV
jgi:hypothetical protein